MSRPFVYLASRSISKTFTTTISSLAACGMAFVLLAAPAFAGVDSAVLTFSPPGPVFNGGKYWTNGVATPSVELDSTFSGGCNVGPVTDTWTCLAVTWWDGSNYLPDTDYGVTGNCDGTNPDAQHVYNPGGGNDFAIRAQVTGNCLVNVSSKVSNTLAWSVDVTAPNPGGTGSPATTNASPFTVTYAGASDTQSGIATVALYYKFESGAWTNTGLTATGTSGAFNFTPANGDGRYYFATVATDKIGNTSAFPTGNGTSSTLRDTDPPAVSSINFQSPLVANTNAATVTFAVTFDESVTSVTPGNFSVNATGGQTGAVITSATGSGISWSVTVNTVDNAAGNLTINLSNVAGILDLAGNTLGGTHVGDQTYIVDRVRPLITSITRMTPLAALTNSPTVEFKVIFNKNITGFAAANLLIESTGVQNGATVASVLNSTGTLTADTEWRVVLNTVAGDGNLSFDVTTALALIQDSMGNVMNVAFTAAETYTVDRTAPTIQSINRLLPLVSNTNAASVTFRVTFSESVSGFALNNVALTTTGGQGAASISSVSGGGTTGAVLVNTVDDAIGTIRADLNANLSNISDAAGNVLSVPRDGDEIYSIDRLDPTLLISSTAPDPTNTSPIPFDIDFNETVLGFDQTDINVTNGVVTSFIAVSGTAYDVLVTPSGSPVTVGVAILAGVCVDSVGNSNTAATPITRDFDSDDPTVILSTPDDPGNDGYVNNNPLTINVVFSEPVTGFDPIGQPSDFVLSSGTVSSASGSGASYTVDITPGTQGPLTITIPVNAAQDGGSNPNSPGTLNLIYDTTPPLPTIQNAYSSPTNLAPLGFLISFPEVVVNFTGGDVQLTNATLDFFQSFGDNKNFNVTVAPTAQGLVTITVPAGVTADRADNGNSGPVSTSLVYDSIGPNVSSITRNDINPTQAQIVGYTVVFDDPTFNLSAADFDLVGGAKIVTGASIQSITSTDPQTFVVVVDTGAGAGTLGLNVVTTGTATDITGNNINAPAVGPVYSLSDLTIDNNLPSVVTAAIGGNVTLAVTASSTVSAIDYQWYRDDGSKAFTPVPSAMGNALVLEMVEQAMTGEQYYVEVSDALVSIDSNVATLDVVLGLPAGNALGLAALAILSAIGGVFGLRQRRLAHRA